MRYAKKSLYFIACCAVAFMLLFAFTEGLSIILIFPILAIAAFSFIYLVKQQEQDFEQNVKDGVRWEKEDQDAEQWIKHDLVPRTLSFIKHHHWPIILYSFLFAIGVAYLWSYLTVGQEAAFQNAIYAAILVSILVMYVIAGPFIFNYLYKAFPKRYRKYATSDWIRGYLFLLPLTFIAYILAPFIGISEPIAARVLSFPMFFLGYTLLFLCAASILYLRKETKKEDEKRLKKSVKEYLRNE